MTHDGHHALSGLVSASLGGLAAGSMTTESPWLRFAVGVTTTAVGWVVTQMLSHLLTQWKARKK